MIVGDVGTKGSFAQAVRTGATQLRAAIGVMSQLRAAYIARTYQPGGADQIANGDVAAQKVTPTDISSLLADGYLIARLEAIMTEQTPIAGTIAGNKLCDAVRTDM